MVGVLHTDLGFVRQVLTDADQLGAIVSSKRHGIHCSTIRRWRLHAMLQPAGWPTDADVAAWRADHAANAARRAVRARQVAAYRQRRYIARGPLWVPDTGTVRRLRALCALGYTCADLAPHLGVTAGRVSQITAGRQQQVTRDTATAVRRLYDQFSMQLPDHPAWLLGRTRRTAAAKGWVPPLAWDDHEIDDPDARPYRIRDGAA